MLNCKHSKTPVSPGSKLNKEGQLIDDITSYRALVGSL